jgi:PBP1b-binding outer membrane lipoprotein LpoB
MMKSSLVFLLILLGILLSACASQPQATASVATNDALPEIAPYDDEPFELLPDTVPVVEEAS